MIRKANARWTAYAMFAALSFVPMFLGAAVTFSDFGLINGVPLFKVSGLASETLTVQRKAAGEAEWSASSCRLVSSPFYAFGTSSETLIDDGGAGSNKAVTFRVSADGGANYTEFTYTPRKTLKGTAWNGGTYYDTCTHAKSRDANPNTYFEPTADTKANAFVGYTFTSKKRFTGVRVVPRSGGDWSYKRLNTCKIKVADSGAEEQVLCTVSGVNAHAIFDIPVAEPLIGTSIRIVPGSDIINVTEIEFIGEDYVVPTTLAPSGIINGLAMFYSDDQKAGETLEAEWRYGVQTAYASCAVTTIGQTGARIYYKLGSGEKLTGNVSVRVRVVGTDDWTEMSWSANDGISGTVLSSDSWTAGHLAGAAFDGNHATYCEPDAPSGKMLDPASWFGLDFGRRRLVTGCRLMPRYDCAARASGRWVEVSDTPDFAQVTLVGLTPSAANYQVSETTFETPVRGRYVRVRNSSSQTAADVINFAELEFLTTERTPALTVSVTPSDISNAHAVVSWNTAKAAYAFVNVYTAPAVGGPWTLAQAGVPYDACWTNAADVVGVKTYYAVIGSDGSSELDALSDPVSYTRFANIDRDPSTGLLRTGVTAISGRSVSWVNNTNPNQAFDNSLSTAPDGLVGGKTGAGNVALGVDLAQDYVVKGIRYYARAGNDWGGGRIANNNMYGVPDGQGFLYASTKVNPSKTTAPVAKNWRALVEGFVDMPARQFFLYGNNEFFGNVAELQIYGYPASAMLANLTAPETITVLPRANGVFVTWQPCPVATGYAVERRDATNSWTTVYEGAVSAYLDTAAETNVVYEYRVKSVKDAASAYSGAATIAYVEAADSVSADWAEAFALGSGVTGAAAVAQDGTITLRAAGGETDRYGEKGYWLRRTVKSGFTASCQVTNETASCVNGETVYMTVRAGAGEGQPFAAIGFRIMKSYDGKLFGSFGVRSRKTVNGAVTEDVAWTTPVANLSSAQLRIKQTGDRVRCWKRTASDAAWVQVADMPFAAQTFGATVESGLMATTPNGADSVPAAQWTVSNYVSEALRGLLLVFR